MLDVEFVFDVAHGSTTSPADVGAVGVVDGSMCLPCIYDFKLLTYDRKLEADSLEAGRCSAPYGP